ncbi:hypothetical protein [Chamaesiphon sp. OTE_8_metabat_110]|nr:hypothetical protein [Chamaesiphon sp. OTE_8_metabat_110]
MSFCNCGSGVEAIEVKPSILYIRIPQSRSDLVRSRSRAGTLQALV